MEDDPFFNTTPPVEEKKEEPPKDPEPPEKLPDVKVEPPKEEKVEKKPKEEKLKEEKPKKVKKYITLGPIKYTQRQKNIATIIYLFIVASCLIMIFGAIFTLVTYLMPSGKLTAFLDASFGIKMAVIGGGLAVTFFLIFFFYGLAKRGVKVVTKIVFKTRELDEKYKNRTSVKIFAGAIMLSLFAIIVGVVWGLIEESLSGGTGALSTFLIALGAENLGLIIILFGAAVLGGISLIFLMTHLWYNGYYVIIKMIGGLDQEDE